MGWGGVGWGHRQTTGAACEQIKVMKAKMSPGKHLSAEPRAFNERAATSRGSKEGKVSRVQWMGGSGGGWVGGWTDGWAGRAGRKDVKEESGRVESGDQEVEGKFSVKVFANKGITMQRSLCAAPPSSHLLCHCHSLHPSFSLSSTSLCFLLPLLLPLTLVPTSLKSLPRSWHSSLFL